MLLVYSDVLAAHASFLWDIDESEEEGRLSDDAQVVVVVFSQG